MTAINLTTKLRMTKTMKITMRTRKRTAMIKNQPKNKAMALHLRQLSVTKRTTAILQESPLTPIMVTHIVPTKQHRMIMAKVMPIAFTQRATKHTLSTSNIRQSQK